MNFIEAFKAMQDGLMVEDVSDDHAFGKKIYKIIGGYILTYNNFHNRWSSVKDGVNEFKDRKFRIFKQQNDTLIAKGGISFCKINAQLPEMYLQHVDVWEHALKVFFILKAHPKSKKAKDNYEQYVFEVDYDFDGKYVLRISSKKYLCNKIGFVSPCFDNQLDAKEVIEEVGYKNIISCFEIFQGVY